MRNNFYPHGDNVGGGDDEDFVADGCSGLAPTIPDFMAFDLASKVASANVPTLGVVAGRSSAVGPSSPSTITGSISTAPSQTSTGTMSDDLVLSSPGFSTSSLSSGLVINVSYDSSVTDLATTDPTLEAEFKGAVQAAVQYFESVITNPVTVKISFGWGEFAGTPVTGLSTNKATTFNTSYSNLYAALVAADTQSDVQKAAVATLPSSDPTGGAGVFKVSSAEARILGLNTFFTGTDGSIGLNSSDSYTWTGGSVASGTYDAVGALEHEISEVLGRIQHAGASNIYLPLDFFRYTAADGQADDPLGASAGNLNLPYAAGYNANAFTYFSYDGKTVTLPFDTPAHVAAGADPGDWADTVNNDAFGYSSTGAALAVSPTDLQAMNVLGYNLAAIACFAAGTRIATTDGEVAVESLHPGDTLRSAFGGGARVTWVGYRHIDCSRHPNPELVWPVRIAAHAFEPGRPSRDLYLSPDHAVFVRGALYPIKLLINRATIRQVEVPAVTYYHVEVTSHDVVMAEGLPAETYLDTGNRSAFANGGASVAMRPDFAGDQAARLSRSCVPLLVAPSEVEGVWRELAARADGLGRPAYRPRSTREPNLHLAIGSRRLLPVTVRDNCYFFVLPDGRAPIFLVSHATRPSDVRPWVDDHRSLGVMVQRLTIRRNSHNRDVAMDDPALERGWWDVEWQGARPGRWTNGSAELSPLGSGVLEVALNGVTDYLQDPAISPAMAAIA